MKKDQLIIAYQQAATEATRNPTKLNNSNNGHQYIANTTEWMISWKQNTKM
jgi:hypothetical protein